MGLRFDVHDRDDPNGTALATLARVKHGEIRMALFPDLGGGKFVIHRNDAQATRAIIKEKNWVKVYLTELSTVTPIWAFCLTEGRFDLIATGEEGEEELEFGGPGPMFYLDDARLWDIASDGGDGPRADAKWHWPNNRRGAIANRLLDDAQARSADLLAALDHSSWDASQDSDGNDWPAFAGDFTLDIGIGYVEGFRLLTVQANDFQPVMSPNFVLDSYVTYGRDLTGAFGIATVRFEKGVNILTGLAEDIIAQHNGTHALVGGSGGVYAEAVKAGYSGGSVRREVFVAAGELNNATDLTERGTEELRRRNVKAQSHEIGFPVGDDPANGFYLPGSHLLPGDTVSVHTGTTGMDLNEEERLVYAIRLVMAEADGPATATRDDPGVIAVAELTQEGAREEVDPGEGAGSQHPTPHPAPECPPPTGGTTLWSVDYSDGAVDASDTWIDACTGLSTTAVAGGSTVENPLHGCAAMGAARGIQGGSYGGWIDIGDDSVLTFNMRVAKRGGGTILLVTINWDDGTGPCGNGNLGTSVHDLVSVGKGFSDNCANNSWSDKVLSITPPATATRMRFKYSFDGAIQSASLHHGAAEPDCEDYAVEDPGTSPYYARSDDPRFTADDQHNISRLRRLLTNNSGGDLTTGAVVIPDGLSGFTTTTTPGYTDGVVGVLAEDIADGSDGYVSLIAPVSTLIPAGLSGAAAGDYIFTSSTPGEASTGAARAAGAVGRVISDDGADPTSIEWWGVPDEDPGAAEAGSFQVIMEGGGSVLTTGIKADVDIPYDLTLTGWRLLGFSAAGAVKIDVWSDVYGSYPPTDADSITNGHEPEIAASGVKAEDTNISDWSDVTLPGGSTLRLNIDSIATFTRVTAVFYFTKGI